MINTLQQDAPVTEGITADLAAHCISADRVSSPSALGPLFVREIGLHAITFSYPGGGTVVPLDTTLTLQRGEWLHILGPSGGGKSTLVALLLGLLRVDAGHISFDGKAADPAERLRGPGVAIVMQDTRFLRGSVAENLAFPRPPEHLNHTLALELMHEIGLDFALDTNLGQDGSQLSGGQRQRLAIVKALLNQPELLVLDEATAQLDHDFEQVVFEVIRRRLPDATVIVIAHKLDSAMGFDRAWEKCGQYWCETRI
jgi:ABC-type bacteriocin/lantibiotic exporter with double-glycine peptidase domain